MSGTVLVLGDSAEWREGLASDLDLSGIAAEGVATVEDAEEVLRTIPEQVAGVVIAAYGARAGAARLGTNSVEAARAAADRLAVTGPGVPMIFVAPVPSLLLAAYVRRSKLADIVSEEAPEAIREALKRLRRAPAAVPSEPGADCCATVEITVDTASITFVAMVDPGQEVIARTRLPWDGLARVRPWDEFFHNWRLMRPGPRGEPEPSSDWPAMLRIVGEQVAAEIGLGKSEQARALERCLQRVRSHANIHFRFTLPAGLMGNVPFDLLFDTEKNLFLRETAPVARRVFLADIQRIRRADPRESRDALTGRVLCVLADAHGSLQVGGRSFRGRPDLPLRRLRHVRSELARVFAIRRKAGLPRPVLLNLARQEQPLDALLEALRRGPWDIVHFAGHSVRDDSAEVLLVLPPGKQERWLTGTRIADFGLAAAEGHARLVLLSSCESSSPDTVFRLAQAGASAVIGFRWEVDDTEAAMFTSYLHERLGAGVPLAQAYHAAVSWLRGLRLGSPTFASPILAVQEESWAVAAAVASQTVPQAGRAA